MSWRIEIRHSTEYHYPRTVMASYNEARLTPMSTAGQVTITSRLDVSPKATLRRYRDYWGTQVHTFDLHVPHDQLDVVATSVVETGVNRPSATADEAPATWASLDHPAFRDTHYEMLTPTPFTTPDDAVLEAAAAIRNASATPADAVVATVAWMKERLAYEKGATSTSTSAVEALRVGGGVCQDFVHVAVTVLRAAGIPARYVSGYFLPSAKAAVDETVVGESHAWAEAWTGGWQAFDPTNPVEVAHRHVLVARGRQYGDVSPLKGIYSGSPSSTHTVRVEMTRRS